MLQEAIIGGHAYNWHESIFKVDALEITGVTAVGGAKVKVEQAPQWGTKREAFDIATGKVEIDVITVTFYAYAWTPVAAYLMGKSLGRGMAFARFSWSAMAAGNPLKGAPPVGDVYTGCGLTEVGKEYQSGPDGLKVDVSFQPRLHRDINGIAMVTGLP